jgi:phosphatidylglycerophosphatase A
MGGPLTKLVVVLAVGFGAGRCPVAPGTCGTIAALPIYYLIRDLPLAWYLGFTASSFLAGIAICGAGARSLGAKDPPSIVWDEWVGLLVALTGAPRDWAWVIAGVVSFRLFDIAKPWPVGLAERKLSGGFGIMADDLLAGMYAWLTLQALAWAARSADV